MAKFSPFADRLAAIEQQVKVDKFDVATWAEPRTFALRMGQSWYVLAWFLIAFGPLEREFAGNGGLAIETFAALVAIVVLAAFLLIQCWRGGSITIDPRGNELSWQRPLGLGAARTWRLDEVRSVRARTFAFGHLAIRIGYRTFHLQVPVEAVDSMVTSLRTATDTEPGDLIEPAR